VDALTPHVTSLRAHRYCRQRQPIAFMMTFLTGRAPKPNEYPKPDSRILELHNPLRTGSSWIR